ncbi:hypothetical protein ScPMuIL_001323 [Solemya velum]
MALKLMKGVEKRKFKDTTTIVPTIFSHVRPTAPRPNTEQRMAKKAKDKMMDQLLHGPDDPSQASEEACLVAVENIQPPVAKRPKPKEQDIDESAIDAEQSPAEGMDESDESFHLESEDSASGSDMSTDSQQPAVSDIKFVTFQSYLLELCGMVCCSMCGQGMMVTDTNIQGSCMKISFLCPNSHDNIWRSQPLVNKITRLRRKCL